MSYLIVYDFLFKEHLEWSFVTRILEGAPSERKIILWSWLIIFPCTLCIIHQYDRGLTPNDERGSYHKFSYLSYKPSCSRWVSRGFMPMSLPYCYLQVLFPCPESSLDLKHGPVASYSDCHKFEMHFIFDKCTMFCSAVHLILKTYEDWRVYKLRLINMCQNWFVFTTLLHWIWSFEKYSLTSMWCTNGP